jgi:DNA polymerase I
MNIQEQQTERLAVFDAEYTVETGHTVSQPIIHLFCRDGDGDARTIEVEGFRPYFYVSVSDFCDEPTDVLNDRHVIGVECDLSTLTLDADGTIQRGLNDDPEALAETLTATANETQVVHNTSVPTALNGTDIVKVYTVKPQHVKKIRDHWDQTWEADVPFERRFCISSGVYRGIEIPTGAVRVRYENWRGHSSSAGCVQELSPADPPDIRPRMCVVDIEVETKGGGIQDPANASNRITAISAYDNYTDSYAGWVLESEKWDSVPDASEFESDVESELGIELSEMSVYDHETKMVEDFHAWFLDRNFDMASGWNSNSYDFPYIIERSWNISAYSIRDWDVFDDPWTAGDEWPEAVVDGLCLFDMYEAYEKTQYRELDSQKLDDVAEAELGYGKVELGESFDDAWHNHPIKFLRYNVRDVEAVVKIEQKSELIALYENMRDVTGAQYNTCHHNGPMLDTLFLRQAYSDGVALTTNYAPEQGDYHGAHVFDPVPGKHEHVIYPDLASLYPYIAYTLNISPETLYTSAEEYRSDGYEDDQMFTAYIDTRDWKIVPSGESLNLSSIDTDVYKGVHDQTGSRKKKDSQGFDGLFDPQFHEIYFVKPEYKEGLVRKTIDLLVDLKYQYKSDKSMYAAVKRVTNSLYGTLGDSATGGKGFRLFDWRLAESITLAGQKVIKFTAEMYVDKIEQYAAEAGIEPDAYLVGGDTDSAMCSVPCSPDYETTLQWARRASQEFQTNDDGSPGLYDTFMEQEFDVIHGEDEHRMDVEIEALASGLFFVADPDRDDNVGIKKRYAQHVVWDDGDGWLDLPDASDTDYDVLNDPDDQSEIKSLDSISAETYETGPLQEAGTADDDIDITGFEYVRSDAATVTKEVQLEVLKTILLVDDPADRLHTFLSEYVDDVRDGTIPRHKLGRPKGISNELDAYGWKSVEELENDSNYTVTDSDRENGGRYVSTPSPTYRGAKYADDHFQWEDISGGKPTRFYVETVRGNEYPPAYEYDSYPNDDRPAPPEVGRAVDAIAVDNPSKIPDAFILDTDTMIEKEIEDKIQPILRTIGEDWNGLVGTGRQTGLDQWA